MTTSPWDVYAEKAITAGAERCAIFDFNGMKWAGVGPNGGVTTIRDIKTLINDVQAEIVTNAMNFDGTQFLYLSTSDGITVGQKGGYACAVCPMKTTIIIVITLGSASAAHNQIVPVRQALAAVGQ
jgi:hypothetical protein